jgi:hypothetical protein
MDWVREKIEADRRNDEVAFNEIVMLTNIERALHRGMPMLWDELVAAIEREVQVWNEGHNLKPERQVALEKSSDPNSLQITGKTIKQVPINGGYEPASCPFLLHVYFRPGSKKVEYVAEPEFFRGSLSIYVGSGALPAFFENQREITVERASKAILEKFLDTTGKPVSRNFHSQKHIDSDTRRKSR